MEESICFSHPIATDGAVEVHADGFASGSAEYVVLTDGEAWQCCTGDCDPGGASIRNDAPWRGKWTSLGEIKNSIGCGDGAKHDGSHRTNSRCGNGNQISTLFSRSS